MFELVLNSIAAFFTSILSAIIGMGGGITLLGIMLLTLELSALIPIHGCIQLASNSSRLFLFWNEIRWDVIRKYAITAIPFSFFGILLVGKVDASVWGIFIASFILFALYFPKKKLKGRGLSFYFAGAMAGSLSMVVGATGPLIAPFFLDKGLTKENIIASKATCQAFVHLMKVPLYGWGLGFRFSDHWLLIVCMTGAVILGTWVGKGVLRKYVSEKMFILLYKSVLTLIALKILVWDGVAPNLSP